MDRRLTIYILIGMVLGVVVGQLLYTQVAPSVVKDQVVPWLKLLSDIFLNLIKMLVAPLVLSTIVVGIANMGDSAALGRIGFRSIAWFIIASLISIGLGLVMVNLFQPGVGAPIPDAAAAAAAVGEVKELKATEFILSVFPKNAIEALATNNILQILVFSLFAGVALSAIGEKGAALVRGADALAEMMLQVTGYVMRYAPVAVFGALAKVVAVSGLGILGTYVELVTEFYFSLALLWLILLTIGGIFLGRRIWTLIRYIREPMMIAFSTASSEAALPKLFEQLDRFGVPRRISGFMLPLGYSFNLDGSMMYMSFATIFIAQAYGIDLSIGTQIAILLTLMISSKGVAAVPRASLVVITGTLAMFGLPVEGVAIILAIDQFLDMGRTATNVVGNAVATSVITKWEGMLEAPEPEFVEHPHAPAHTAADGRAGLELDPSNFEDERK
ncbi:dicarboxylate/amino acid:cation symporter [Novosphingobium sp.]|uniref:dicarboxylate/amino acid:cation symporter n=1 Tax=Novosphingobium sp. TaxID=1874826 RepID=UPI0022C8214E|nr:dicarboxylate/amino acid:cation symporter [Novosphingobium sp.]MCZ8018247.1 dicarboxylate/amino acid:cation symporter [Novosphingobium sp.]MCZ8033241.1 dicarboxylate/amino acid:cation symporter [Novosphingobium sp.]MCZ8051696.1 dicarboxylate/amino acid:cation symporter [Novosphingobium sp.]MCZ8060238.1 dicarboxylate/amino acid:cation symporter [Novosphingobium sp.]MCZ8231880.1 dicarboxylate/amino acid:cation symporter [Novosphingobium sp.]